MRIKFLILVLSVHRQPEVLPFSAALLTFTANSHAVHNVVRNLNNGILNLVT